MKKLCCNDLRENSIGISSHTMMETKKEFIPLLQQKFSGGQKFFLIDSTGRLGAEFI
jgi:hypothetical protein